VATVSAPTHLRVQATADLQRALDELCGPNPDLVGITMRAHHAFRMLGAKAEIEALSCELGGYPPKRKLPSFRRLLVTYRWETSDTRAAANEAIRGSLQLAERHGHEDWFGSLQTWVSSAQGQHEIKWPTGEAKEVLSTALGRRVHWTEWAFAAPSVLSQRLDEYRAHLYDLVGRWVVTLLTAGEAESLWDALRVGGDALAAKAGVGDSLQGVVRAALSDDPSAWRSGLLACRNIIDDLSRYLYRAPGPTYPHIRHEGKEIAVDGGHYRNRLVAYLHQKGLDADDRELVAEHLEWFKGFAALVNALGSSGKRPVGKRDIGNGLMHTYLLFSEIAARTDGEPVTAIVDPSRP